MPKQAEYKIVWSDEKQGYEILHGAIGFPLCREDDLCFWLSRLDTCSFCSATSETMTLRKERRERGGGYWRAYKRVSPVEEQGGLRGRGSRRSLSTWVLTSSMQICGRFGS